MAKKKEISGKFGFRSLLLTAIGSTIGAGVFVLLPIGIDVAGLGILLSLLLSSIITIFVAVNYGELAASMPMEGGGYSWVTKAFGKESSSFIVGWLIWLGNMGYAAFSALGFSIFAGIILDVYNPIPLALAAIAFFTIINTLTTKTSINIEKFLTITLISIFVIFWAYLGLNVDVASIESALYRTEAINIFSAASLLYVLFIGFEAVSTISGEAKRATDLPKAFVYCIVIVTVVYMLTALLVIGNTAGFGVSAYSLLDISGPMAPLIVIAASFATLAAMNAGLIAASRNAYALSRDGMIPKAFRKVNKDFNTPFIAVIASGLMSSAFIMSNAVEYVASIADFGYLICISMVCSSVIILRLKEPKMKRPYKVPFYPYTTMLGMVLPIALITFLEPNAIDTGLLWIFVGFFVYNFYKLAKVEARKEKTQFSRALRKFV